MQIATWAKQGDFQTQMLIDWTERLKMARRISIVLLGLYAVAGIMPAQTATQTASPTAASQAAISQTTSPAQEEFKPMTQGERFHHYVHGMFSVEALARSAAGAAILQETNTPAEWGQGADGYARRFGNSYAQHLIRQTLMYGASDLLDEDNRFIPSGRSGFRPRLTYALESSFLARRHDGSRRISFSRLGSYAAVAVISREWQPYSTSDAQSAVMSFGTTMGSEIGFNIAREFLPGIFHRH
jgi:hypothetical protein